MNTARKQQTQFAKFSMSKLNEALVIELNLEESLPAKSLSTYYAPFNAASYVIRIAMPHSTYASYVGFARKKGKEQELNPNCTILLFLYSTT